MNHEQEHRLAEFRTASDGPHVVQGGILRALALEIDNLRAQVQMERRVAAVQAVLPAEPVRLAQDRAEGAP